MASDPEPGITPPLLRNDSLIGSDYDVDGDSDTYVQRKIKLAGVAGSNSSISSNDKIWKELESEAGNLIKYRTCSWQKTAALLFSKYICLAVMSFPYSCSVLGLVPGLLLTILVAGVVLYTSLIIWEFCLRHPEVRDVCDIGQYLFWDSKIAWYFTAAMFLLNNTFIQVKVPSGSPL
ncbi:predicted protein [Histoplasma capsulatum var. duboisii H88]|uniref:Predicted protein n=2 Tax=Ajellomyces capsulatus TaxID=5037 RepID=F0UJ80_AJEC8|nr:predicted protein [Histoplasma capsulatum H143]EGC46525.1 predicted protein [Histoplasma capsulatum var. duboisii H88]